MNILLVERETKIDWFFLVPRKKMMKFLLA